MTVLKSFVRRSGELRRLGGEGEAACACVRGCVCAGLSWTKVYSHRPLRDTNTVNESRKITVRAAPSPGLCGGGWRDASLPFPYITEDSSLTVILLLVKLRLSLLICGVLVSSSPFSSHANHSFFTLLLILLLLLPSCCYWEGYHLWVLHLLFPFLGSSFDHAGHAKDRSFLFLLAGTWTGGVASSLSHALPVPTSSDAKISMKESPITDTPR